MADTNVPGLKAQHAVVTPACIDSKGISGACGEALERLRIEFLSCSQYVANRHAHFHFVLTVDRPNAPNALFRETPRGFAFLDRLKAALRGTVPG